MQIITLHHTDTGEIIGLQFILLKINFPDFYDEIYKSFSEYHKSEEYDYHYDIDDFVEYHNNNSKIKLILLFQIIFSYRNKIF